MDQPRPIGDRRTRSSISKQALTNGPRSSPFTPPKENDHTFVVDSAAGLDTGCSFRSQGPLEFDVEITRNAGDLASDGTLKDADALIAAGLLSPTATLTMPGFDVDSQAVEPPPFQPERDRVLFNGVDLGFLEGEDNQWKLNEFQVDIRKVKFAARGAPGGAPAPAKNHITIEIDTANTQELWCTAVDWAALSFKAMSPIILVHGNNSDGAFFDRRHFTDELTRQHLLFDNSINLPTAFIAKNGQTLDGKIPAIVKSFGVDSVHVVGHSKGGLDLRDYLAFFQPGHEKDFSVLSYTTLSTPHNGSVLADLSIQYETAKQHAVELHFSGFPLLTETILQNAKPPDDGRKNLTTSFTAGFNAQTASAVSPSTVFQTVAADADVDSSGHITRSPDEYLELRQEDADLQKLDAKTVLGIPVGHTLSENVVDDAWLVLRNTATVGLQYRERITNDQQKETVALLISNPTQGALGNDTLVTIPSGRGIGSIASRVKKYKVYTGTAGRNHSSVANQGVAADVIPWIVGVEKTSGDLR